MLCRLYDFHTYDAMSYEIGWVLGKEHWGKGYVCYDLIGYIPVDVLTKAEQA